MKLKFKDLDILVLKSGQVVQIIELDSDSLGSRVRWMDESEDAYLCSPGNLDIQEILPPTGPNLLTFNAARSIHIRFNNLNRV